VPIKNDPGGTQTCSIPFSSTLVWPGAGVGVDVGGAGVFVGVMVFVIVTMAFVVVGKSCEVGTQDVMRAVLSPSVRMHRKLAQ